jgi:hypothetical protein
MPDPNFDGLLARVLFQIWRHQWKVAVLLQGLSIPIYFKLYYPLNKWIDMQKVDLAALSYSGTYFFNFLMHSGLSVPLPFSTYRIPIIPQFVPNTCEAAAEMWDQTVWPCQRDAIAYWGKMVWSGQYGWKLLLWHSVPLIVLVMQIAMFGFMLVWGCGIFPNARWRQWWRLQQTKYGYGREKKMGLPEEKV